MITDRRCPGDRKHAVQRVRGVSPIAQSHAEHAAVTALAPAGQRLVQHLDEQIQSVDANQPESVL